MENYYPYPDSHDSSPRSREIDTENASWDEPPSNYKVKFMCSYGGKIHPRPQDNQLAYVGGETKILSVDRNIKFPGFMSKISSICEGEVCLKYQLPGEDLDALISVTNDEDLEHMMLEYDRLCRPSNKQVRLRLFLFPLTPPASTSFGSNETKSERQWFVDALNSVQIQPLEGSSPQAAASETNPDFLFGLDKGLAPPPPVKLQDPTPPPTVPDVLPKDYSVRSDPGSEDRHVVGDPVVSPADYQRQIQELQRLQIASQEQAMFQRKNDESNTRAYPAEYYAQKIPEKLAPAPQQMPVSIPATYWPERHMTTGGYPVAASTGTEQSVYLIHTSAGVYQTPGLRPMTGQLAQPYYGMQRVVSDVYREPQVYNAAPPHQQQKVGAYGEGMGMMRPSASGVGVTEQGYAQVTYDSTGRQVYYTTPGGAAPSYQAVTTAAAQGDVRQGGVTINQDGKVVAKTSQGSL